MGLVDARAPAGAYTCITIIMEEPNRQNVYILCLYIGKSCLLALCSLL